MRTCAHCGKPLDGHRADAKVCGAPCRTAVWRARATETAAHDATALAPTSPIDSRQSRSQTTVAVTTPAGRALADPGADRAPRIPPAEQAQIEAALIAALFASRRGALERVT
jgi:hypothetical protein